MAAVDEHTAHAQADDESLVQPYGPVLSLTSPSVTATDAEHEHAKRGENTTGCTKQAMVACIEKAAGDEGRKEEEEGLGPADQGNEGRAGVWQEMAMVVGLKCPVCVDQAPVIPQSVLWSASQLESIPAVEHEEPAPKQRNIRSPIIRPCPLRAFNGILLGGNAD